MSIMSTIAFHHQSPPPIISCLSPHKNKSKAREIVANQNLKILQFFFRVIPTRYHYYYSWFA